MANCCRIGLWSRWWLLLRWCVVIGRNKIKSLMQGRNREFGAVRSKHLAETLSQIGCLSKNTSAPSLHSSSLRSSFLKTATPVCPTCLVSKKAVQKKEEQRSKQQLQLQEIRESFEQGREQERKIRANRRREMQGIAEFNSQSAQRQLASTRSDKQLDFFFLQDALAREQQIAQLEQQAERLRKEKEEQYRLELHRQYQEQNERRQQQKQARRKEEPSCLALADRDRGKEKEQYAQELKKQIHQQERSKQQQKQIQNQLNQTELERTQRDFLNYSEFKTPPRSEANPEMFAEMKELYEKKKAEKLEARAVQQAERKAQLKRHKEQLQKTAREGLNRMKTYADTLSAQILRKTREQEHLKAEDWREVPVVRFSQQSVLVQTKLPCGECHHLVSEPFLTSV